MRSSPPGRVRKDHLKVDIMAVQKGGGQRRRKRHLSAQEKYQVGRSALRPGHQREVADRWGIDRSTVVHIVKTAREGALERLAASRPGRPASPRSSWRSRTRTRKWSGCGRRSPSRRWSCTCFGEKEAGTDRRPGPRACGCRHQARAAHPGRPRREVRLVGPPRLQRARGQRPSAVELAAAPGGGAAPA